MEWKKRLNANSFYASLSILIMGNGGAQGLNLIFSFLFARIFDLGTFGEFGIFTAFVFVMGEVLNLKMDQAIILCKNETEVKISIGFANKIGFLLSLLGSVLFFLFQLFNNGVLIHAIFCFFSLWIYGQQQMALTYHLWLKNFKIISASRLVQVLGGSLFTLMSYQFFHSFNSLIIGFLLGNLCSFLFLRYKLIPNKTISDNEFSYNFNPKEAFENFITYGTFSSLLNTLGRNLPFFLFKNFYGLNILGGFSFSNRIIQAPIGIVTQALGKVFFQKAAENEIIEKSLNRKLIKETVIFSFFSGIIPTLILSFFGTLIFVYFFGEKWHEAGKMSMIMAPLFFISYITQPISMYLDVKKELKWEFFFNLSFLLVRFVFLYYVCLGYSFEISLYVYTFIGIFFYLILLFKIWSISKS